MGLEAYAEAVYPLHHFGWSDLRALRQGRYKLIAAPRPELYDLQEDPARADEHLSGPQGARRPDARAAAARWKRTSRRRRRRSSQAVEVDPDAKARLAALGYVGSFVANVGDDASRAGLADPKDKVHLFNMITRARDLGTRRERVRRRHRDARRGPQGRPESHRRVVHARQHVGAPGPSRGSDRVLQARAGAEARRRGSRHQPGARRIGNSGATTTRSSDSGGSCELDPKNAQVHYEIAQILIDRGDLHRGDPGAAAGAAGRADHGGRAKRARRRGAQRRGTSIAPEQEIRQALAQKPDVRLAHFNLALIAEQRGDPRHGGRRSTSRSSRSIPEATRRRSTSGRLYDQTRRPGGAGGRLSQGDRGQPRVRGRLFLSGEAAARQRAAVRRSGHAREERD